MLGYDVSVYKQSIKSESESRVAGWQTGIRGLDWLDELVKEKRAAYLSRNGYPEWYFVTAGILLPIITVGLPANNSPLVVGDDYILPKNWSSDIVWNHDAVLACSKADLLIVEAWDQS